MTVIVRVVITVLLLVGGARAETAASHEVGREIYNYRCYYCHGYSGDAKTLAATMMTPTPADFTQLTLATFSRERMIQSVTLGVDGTAMKSFTQYLNQQDIETVVDFIRTEFMEHQRINTLYHTTENGWPEHERYALAYPFATGDIPLDLPLEQMTSEQRAGFRLYMTTCISCHDRSKVEDEGLIWRARSISFPRNNFSYTDFKASDGTTGASVFLKHETPIDPSWLQPIEAEGQTLFSTNCAFCHGEDGSGKNWIGAFLDAAPQDLTDSAFLAINTPESLMAKIKWGKKDTSMPAWQSILSDTEIQKIITFIYVNADIRHAQIP